VEDAGHDRAALGVGDEPALGPALVGFGFDRVRDAVGEVAVGRGADVPPVQGMLLEPFPGFFLDLQPEPFGHALLDAADQDGGGIDAFDGGGLVGGEQHDSLIRQFAFEFQRVEGVAAGALDVFADHGGEPGQRGVGFGQQLGHAPVARNAGGDERFPVAALGAFLKVDPPRFHVPVVPGHPPAWGHPFLAGVDLTAQRRQRVLQHQRGGARQDRDRDGLSRPGGGRHCLLRAALCSRDHSSNSLSASAWAASIAAAFLPVSILILNRTFIPPGLCSSVKL
jgi:hypothetical protein